MPSAGDWPGVAAKTEAELVSQGATRAGAKRSTWVLGRAVAGLNENHATGTVRQLPPGQGVDAEIISAFPNWIAQAQLIIAELRNIYSAAGP